MVGNIPRFPGLVATPPQQRAMAARQESVSRADTMTYSSYKPLNLQEPKFEVDKKLLVSGLKKMAIGSLVGAVSLGGSALLCMALMTASHTDGQENTPFVAGGLAFGVAAGAVASMCGVSPMISFAVGGAVTQSIMSLADWFGRG